MTFDITPEERNLSVEAFRDFSKRFSAAAEALEKGDDKKAVGLVNSVLEDVKSLDKDQPKEDA